MCRRVQDLLKILEGCVCARTMENTWKLAYILYIFCTFSCLGYTSFLTLHPFCSSCARKKLNPTNLNHNSFRITKPPFFFCCNFLLCVLKLSAHHQPTYQVGVLGIHEFTFGVTPTYLPSQTRDRHIISGTWGYFHTFFGVGEFFERGTF